MPDIHPTAIVGERVKLGHGVNVGPHAIIENDVTIGDRTSVGPSALIGRHTEIGADNEIGFMAHLGGEPQIVGWERADSRLVIGSHNIIREFVTVHRAKEAGDATVIGDHCYLMVTAHVAHDCRIGNHVTICNGSLVAGHVEVGDHAFISGNCVIHQFVRLGRLTMLRGLTAVGKDVLPFTMIDQTNLVRGLNTVGLRRSEITAPARREIKSAFKAIFRTTRPVTESVEQIESQPMCDEVREMIEFIRASERGICVAHTTARRGFETGGSED